MLPTALIITYQLAEQGVDLPGYSHVVNVHIPAYPSALEQRSGRIDRMDSDYTEIKMHYFLGEDRFWDSNTINFRTAAFFYLTNLISYLPAKNALLTSDILKKSKALKEEAGKYLTQVEDAVHTWVPGAENTKLVEEFCQDFDIPWNEEDKTDWAKDADEKLKALRKALTPGLSPDSYSKLLDECTGDKIFYFVQLPEAGGLFPSSETVAQNIHLLNGVDCAEKISTNEEYMAYHEKFKSEIEPLICFAKYQDELEKRYEELFQDNRIEKIFRPDQRFCIRQNSMVLNWESAQQICNDIVGTQEDAKLYHTMLKYWWRLPFFQMCGAFLEILKDCCLSDDGYVKRQFRKNHLTDALCDLIRGIWTAHRDVFYGYGTRYDTLWLSRSWWTNRLSDEFYNEYLVEKIWKTARTENPFRIENKDGKRLASNWLRLVVQLTQNEPVTRKNGEEVSVLRGFLYSESGPRWTECWWHYAPNLPQRSNEEDWWTRQV